MTDALERCFAFVRAIEERCAERAEPGRFGTAFFVDSLPRVWSLNFVSVDRGIRAGAEELASDADRLQGTAKLAHRRLEIDDDVLGEAAAPGFSKLGWKIERTLVMPHHGKMPTTDTSAVREVRRETLDAVWAEAIWTEPSVDDEETVRQLVLQRQVVQRAVATRYFGAVVDGRVASYCQLYSDGETAQIEDVLTLPEFRGRGLATAVVAKALAEASREHAFVFLLADADDWPKDLYRKLGFESVGRCWSMTREPERQK